MKSNTFVILVIVVTIFQTFDLLTNHNEHLYWLEIIFRSLVGYSFVIGKNNFFSITCDFRFEQIIKLRRGMIRTAVYRSLLCVYKL